MKCFECGSADNLHQHHVVPRSRGGTKTVDLCYHCHAKAHGKKGNFDVSTLTKEALAAKKAQGEYTGGDPPFGFTVAADGVTLEEDDAEQAVIAAVLKYREEGLSLRKISKRLETRGFQTRRGGKFWPTSINRIIHMNKENP